MQKVEKTRLNIYLPNHLVEALDKEAHAKGTSRTALILQVFENYTNAKETIDILKSALELVNKDKQSK